MNKKISFLISILLIAFTGCNESGSFDPAGTETPSETPILLDCNATFNADVVTRSAVNEIAQMDSIGIFGLARAKTGIGGSQHAADPDWNVVLDMANYGATTNGIYWNNLKCLLEPIEDTNKAKVKVADGQEYAWYYPISSWYAYDFFGYYPYSRSYVTSEDSIYVDFETDGTKDIIWGRSEDKSGAENGQYAYSARYMRSIADPVVHMKFGHSLTQFRFHIEPTANSQGSFTEIKKLAVKEIRMHNMYPTLRMTVANRVKAETTGKVYPPADATETIDYILKDTDGNAIEKNPVAFLTEMDGENEVAKKVRVGDCIFAHSDQEEYFISMILCEISDNTKEYHSEKLMTLSLSSGEKFQPGYIYNIYIKATGVTEISLDATLEEWKSADDDENLNFELF